MTSLSNRSFLVRKLLIASVWLCAVPLAAQEKQPVPSAAAQEEAMKLVREVYGDEYAKATWADRKVALAKKIIQSAQKAAEPTNRFALLRVAKDIAIQAGDADLAMQVVNKIAAQYQFGDDDSAHRGIVYEAKLSTLADAARTAKTQDQYTAVVRYANSNRDHAAEDDRFPLAAKFGELALAAARKCRDRELAKQVVARNKEVRESADAYAEVEEAVATLEKLPTDPAANLKVGKYRCFVKGDWAVGLSMLALGSDAGLKNLAVMELGESPDALALGDGWWELGERTDGRERLRLHQRALYWYRKTLSDLDGLPRQVVEKRLASVASDRSDSWQPAYPGGTAEWRGNRYWLSTSPMSIHDAKRLAGNLGGRLVAIRGAEENRFVASLMEGHAFIGVELVGGNTWVNSLGKPQGFFNWRKSMEVRGRVVPYQSTVTPKHIYVTMANSGLWYRFTPDTSQRVCIEWGSER